MGMAVRTLLCHGCTWTALLAAVDAPTHGPLAPPERIRGMPFAARAACYDIHGCIHGLLLLIYVHAHFTHTHTHSC